MHRCALYPPKGIPTWRKDCVMDDIINDTIGTLPKLLKVCSVELGAQTQYIALSKNNIV